jgi:hypothetical protein
VRTVVPVAIRTFLRTRRSCLCGDPIYPARSHAHTACSALLEGRSRRPCSCRRMGLRPWLACHKRRTRREGRSSRLQLAQGFAQALVLQHFSTEPLQLRRYPVSVLLMIRQELVETTCRWLQRHHTKRRSLLAWDHPTGSASYRPLATRRHRATFWRLGVHSDRGPRSREQALIPACIHASGRPASALRLGLHPNLERNPYPA